MNCANYLWDPFCFHGLHPARGAHPTTRLGVSIWIVKFSKTSPLQQQHAIVMDDKCSFSSCQKFSEINSKKLKLELPTRASKKASRQKIA